MKIVREDGERGAREGAGTDWGRAGGGRAWCSGVCCDSMVFARGGGAGFVVSVADGLVRPFSDVPAG